MVPILTWHILPPGSDVLFLFFLSLKLITPTSESPFETTAVGNLLPGHAALKIKVPLRLIHLTLV